MPIYQGDIVEMGEDSGCKIVFADETDISLGEESRLEIDEYVYDPNSEDGKHSFSFLRGVFLFTSGLIGRREPREVDIAYGLIGIRG